MSFPKRATTFALIGALSLALTYPRRVFPHKSTTAFQQNASSGSQYLPRLRAIASTGGVVVQWIRSIETPSLGFNLFRVSKGQTTKLNSSLVAGSALIVRGQSQTYSWFDEGGTVDCEYYVETIDLHGNSVASEIISPVWQATLPPFQQAELLSNLGSTSHTATNNVVWPGDDGAKSSSQIAAESSSPESLGTQWTIANLPALKIGVRSDGWYRINQAQMVAAGFDTTGDARNLQLFVTGSEVALRVSRESGPLNSGDYIEFWGQGIDTPASDTQVYWLVNGSQPGLRMAVKGEVTVDAPPTQAIAPRTPEVTAGAAWFRSLPYNAAETVAPAVQKKEPIAPARHEVVRPEDRTAFAQTAVLPIPAAEPPVGDAKKSSADNPSTKLSSTAITSSGDNGPTPEVTDRKSAKLLKSARRNVKPATLRSRKYRRHRNNQRSTRRRNHVALTPLATPAFVCSVQHNERNIYYPAALNGARENFFGPIVGSDGTTVTLTLHNIATDLSAPAQVQVALQGVSLVTHQVRILVNGSVAGVVSFVDEASAVQTFAIPASLLVEGNNLIRLAPVHPDLCATSPNDPRCSDLSVAEYVRVTYPHIFRAENDSLQFSIKSNQSATVDGFSTSNIRMLDVTDPNGVQEVRPILGTSGAGFSATVPGGGSGKARRIVALPLDRLSQPAWLTLNQPSNLNRSNNAGSLVIISFKDFMPALAPLKAQRESQGYAVSLVNVEDVFDEFSFGVHTPQAIKDFMLRAKTTWSQPPNYLLLVGDASYDPRNYMGFGSFDFVPTKQIDTGTIGTQTAIETASDDWLTDFNDDGIGDISVGRLPVRTLADANLLVSKIVNYSPANTGGRALLVADTQGSYYFNFEAADDELADLLPANMTKQKIYRRLQPSDTDTRNSIVASLNAGQSIMVYSGHGNVDFWAGSIFTGNDATALNNGNRLSFVVVMDCLNGYFDAPSIPTSLAESFLLAPNGGAVGSFASSGLTIPDGQHQMGLRMFQLLYGGSPMAIGDASRQAKSATTDVDVRRTWILFGDPTLKIR